MAQAPDPSLDVLLDLDGQTLVVDPTGGHRVKFVVTRVPVSSEKPHGIDYSLRSRCTDRTVNAWLGSTTPIQCKGRSEEIRRIIATDCERSDRTNTRTRPH